MSINIINIIKDYLNPSVASSYATNLGESESGIAKAFSALAPIIIGAVAGNKSNSGNLFDSVKNIYEGGALNGLGVPGNSSNSIVSNLLGNAFGDKIQNIISTVAYFAGIKNSSVDSLMNVAGTASLGALGKHVTENNLSESDFTKFLSDQKSNISSLIPAGLSLGSLGLGSFFGSDDSPAEEPVQKTTSYENPTSNNNNGGGSSIWKWLLPLILLLLLAWFFWRQYNNKKQATDEQNTEILTSDSDDMSNNAGKEITSIDLNGVSLQGFKDGMEEQMITFLQSGKYTDATDNDLKDQWYNFDNVNFVFGKTDELEPSSEEQLSNIAAILKAYPDAKIKIGAYTDNKGDAATNKDISQKRADYIKSQLDNLGVEAQVIEAEGFGSEFATVPAEASDEERSIDRKIAVRFVK